MRLLVIDNYDSFTYNLVQYLGELGAELEVVRNDARPLEELVESGFAGVVISPGPGRPADAGMSIPAVHAFAERGVPLLGVCLGHQAIGEAFGGHIVRARRIMHGKTSRIHHDGRGVFAGLPEPFEATRYHSLVVDPDSCPELLEVSARTEDGEIMGLRHRSLPVEGVQFHPESVLTGEGKRLLGNFLAACAQGGGGVSLREAIGCAVEGREVPAPLLEAAFGEIMLGEASPVLVAGLLVALRTKGETVGEIVAAARALRARARTAPLFDAGAVDTCGTGGDGADTFNISTVAAFVVAGAGVPVAKHGNRAASGRVGSFDLLEALGVKADLPIESAARVAARVGIGFFFARQAHPAMRFVAPVRAELGVRTLMNCLGPLLNPVGVRHQLVGVYASALVEPIAQALGQLGAARALVVHGEDGLDELTTTSATETALWDGGGVQRGRVEPEALGIARAEPAALRGGDAAENAAIARAVLDGEPGPRRDVVLLNAAGALLAAGAVPELGPGLERARTSIDSGAARERLDALVRHSAGAD